MIPFVSRSTAEMTWLELARAWLPNLPEAELDAALWEETPFPFGSVEDVERQLASYAADPTGHRARIEESLAGMERWEDELRASSSTEGAKGLSRKELPNDPR